MDVEDFSAIVADIYDAALDPPLWRKVLKNVCGFTRGGPSASLFWQDAARKTGNSKMYLRLFITDLPRGEKMQGDCRERKQFGPLTPQSVALILRASNRRASRERQRPESSGH